MMIRRLFMLLGGVALAAAVSPAQEAPKKTAAPAAKPMVSAVAPDDLKWGPLPPSATKGTPSVDPGGDLQIAVVYGDPSKPGYYVLRGKCTDGSKIAPHWHPTTENVTILKGSVALGMGRTFDESKLKALPAGGFASVPPHMTHFAQCKGDTIFQVDGSGPFVLNFISPASAPAKTKAPASK